MSKKERTFSSRSQRYQYLILEIPFEMSAADSDGSNNSMLNSEFNLLNLKTEKDHLYYTEKMEEPLYKLNSMLMAEVLMLIETECTQRQKDVTECILLGMTQIEIGDELQINQSSVYKTLHGSPRIHHKVKTPQEPDLNYGGLSHKLKKEILKSDSIRHLMQQIRKVEEYD